MDARKACQGASACQTIRVMTPRVSRIANDVESNMYKSRLYVTPVILQSKAPLLTIWLEM